MDIFQAVETNPLNSERIKHHLDKIREAQNGDGDLGEAISAAVDQFNIFFLNYGKPYFKENKLHAGIGTPKSSQYNETMTTLQEDLNRLYEMTKAASEATLASYNYSAISSEEIKNSAAEASSKVLDLNILNDFVKGQVIVAGDDFLDDSKIDKTVQPETTQADIIFGSSSVGLKISSAERVSTPEATSIRVTPLSPTKEDGSVMTSPTPENIGRFYEGHFFAPIGEIRPAGGTLAFKYIVDPVDIPPSKVSYTETNGQPNEDSLNTEAEVDAAKIEDPVGHYTLVPETEESLLLKRKEMLDGNPDTFWEGEFVYTVPSLVNLAGEGSQSE